MKQRLVGSGLIVGMLAAACTLRPAPAQDTQGSSTAPNVLAAAGSGQADPVKAVGAPGKPDEGKPESNAGRTTKYLAGVDEILNMVQTGVSTEVIKTYIESSPVAYSLSAADVIALKEHAVPDELTTAMMKRGAALKAEVRQAIAFNSARPANAGGNRRYYRLDPEGYDYFQYYYLYPRTLAAANQSFYSPGAFSPGFGSYGYGYGPGYYGPPPFWPLRPSAFGHP
jgi:hypothetical protein